VEEGTSHLRGVLEENYSWLKTQLEQTQRDLSKAQGKVQQLEEKSPEKLKWELQHVTGELEQLQRRHSETLYQVGQQKQEWLHETAQQKQQYLHLEQESQHLMEELERWRGRYVEAQLKAERLEQECSGAQLKIDQFTQLRERLLTEIGDRNGRNS
jgi:chromosome segregation ATPase